jgi:steroid delta-isomerase-like uncharacterized protein
MSRVRELAERYAAEVWNEGRLAIADELFTMDHRYHDPMLPDLGPGPDGVRERVGAFLEGMPDAVVAVEDWVEDRDAVVARWTWAGTHTGDLLGMPPTGRRASATGMHLFRTSGDRIAETWVSYDALGLLTQLGLVNLGVGAAV